MTRFVVVVFSIWAALSKGLWAQSSAEVVWVQIEAQPTLEEAIQRAASYAAELPDINGFAMPGGWYGIAIGPYLRDDAESVRQTYRAQGLIPRDSYIALSSTYRRQFWPEGADVLGFGRIEPAPTPVAPADTTPPVASGNGTETAEVADTVNDPESRADARRSESLLSRDEKRDLQTALQWAGFYTAAIDGAFGRGTRNAMAAWQNANGLEPTGILTTRQRAVLLGQYNAILEELNLRLVRDSTAGIEIKLPTAMVEFSRYEPPFAQYNAKEGETPQVLLISQRGNRDTLTGLYDVMQTLQIVPLEGPRQISGDNFTLVGRNDRIVSETRARLVGGEIKGFTLIWPAGDEKRRTRLIREMETSFTRLPGALDPALTSDATQGVDLVAGLQVRKPLVSRSGFYVDARGAVVTTADAVQSCTRITLDDLYDATLSQVDPERGLAILRPKEALAPPAVARFSPALPRLQSEVAVAGYSFEGQLSAPSLTFGKISDIKGLRGETDVNRLSLKALPGDEGGPVFDDRGHVFGMLLPRASGGRQLPDEVRFALTGEAIAGVMTQAGIAPQQGTETASLAPEDITERGIGMTVLVSCWE